MSETPNPDPRDALQAHIERARRLLPAWFVPRMMDDHWSFAFLLGNGDILTSTRSRLCSRRLMVRSGWMLNCPRIPD
jgi:hypothetical protein